MDLSSRPFRWDDLPATHALISESWRQNGPNFAHHVGDLYWGLLPWPGRDPEEDIHVWHDSSGHLTGLFWLDHAVGGDVMRHPDTEEQTETIIFARFEDEARRRGSKDFSTDCFLGDDRRSAFLADRGYAKAGYGDQHLLIDLTTGFNSPDPPEGYSVRGITGTDGIERRAEAHRAAWSDEKPSALSTEVYQELVKMPGYRQELDLVAVGPEGTFVSCTNAWYDDALKVGEFQPVGCHPNHRRKGVTRALILEGLHRLKALGAERAIVYTSSDNLGAQKLYESCGFRVIGYNWGFTKQLI